MKFLSFPFLSKQQQENTDTLILIDKLLQLNDQKQKIVNLLEILHSFSDCNYLIPYWVKELAKIESEENLTENEIIKNL